MVGSWSRSVVPVKSESLIRNNDEKERSTGDGFSRCWFASEEAVQPWLAIEELKVMIRCIP
jgi:hypothetical protein